MASRTFTAKDNIPSDSAFNFINIDIEEVGKVLGEYVKRGSSLTGVGLDEINRGVRDLSNIGLKPNLTKLLQHGMKLFDSIVWLHAGRPADYPLQDDPTLTADNVAGLEEISKSLFYVYFFLLTQARYPGVGNNQNVAQIPAFLRNVMGMDKPQKYYSEMICSFPIVKFDARWIKHVNFKGFGQEAMSRFGLGVAGYRLFGPFKLYEPEATYPPNLANAVTFAQTVARSRPTWDVHPTTRNAAILTKRGNLNQNLGNLILEVFTEEQITEMVNAKVLFQKPTRNPTATNYRQWGSEDDVSGKTYIFPVST